MPSTDPCAVILLLLLGATIPPLWQHLVPEYPVLLSEILHCLHRYIADTVILGEIPNSHPYFTGLAIFGGIATFSNPLQGAIVGPMAITVLSVLYQLHSGPTESTPATRLSTPGPSGQWRQ